MAISCFGRLIKVDFSTFLCDARKIKIPIIHLSLMPRPQDASEMIDGEITITA
jgi:hypothetical protein